MLLHDIYFFVFHKVGMWWNLCPSRYVTGLGNIIALSRMNLIIKLETGWKPEFFYFSWKISDGLDQCYPMSSLVRLILNPANFSGPVSFTVTPCAIDCLSNLTKNLRLQLGNTHNVFLKVNLIFTLIFWNSAKEIQSSHNFEPY